MRTRHSLDADWKFHWGDMPFPVPRTHGETYQWSKTGQAQGAARPDYDDAAWRTLDVPHDWAVEGRFDPQENGDHGFLPTGIGWYRKRFTLPAGAAGGKCWLEFDGVFRHSTVWLNGHLLGTQPSGYISFRYDVSDVTTAGGDNVLAVRVDASTFEGWWYEGAGIYRHVWLVQTDPLHIEPWGLETRCEFPDGVGASARVFVQAAVRNDRATDASAVLDSVLYDPEDRPVARARTPLHVPAGQTVGFHQKMTVAQPVLWSVETPALYRLCASVSDATGTLDTDTLTLGLRTAVFDAERGFLLNGQPVKLKGVCCHQDHAGVGVAVPDSVLAYRLRRLKEMGANAYRCAHHPPAPALLDLCDRLGLLVMDETRTLASTPQGLFELESMIRRDRHHACVILWSLGNEEPLQETDVGARIVRAMKRVARRLDPTRPVTFAMNGGWGSAFSDALDVVGFNYFPEQYDPFHAAHPRQPIVASETASTLSTRGEYAEDREGGYVSAYDGNVPAWGASAEAAWKAVVARPFVAGTFVWTGFDYRGEPTPYVWPCISSHFGILDTCGFPKDNFYYYQAWWGPQPVLHLFPHWNWPGREGQPIAVWCHTNGETVELFLDGRSLGRRGVAPYGHAEWSVPYAPGVLTAKGYRAGALWAEAEVSTVGPPARLRVETSVRSLRADGHDTAVLDVTVTDAQGRWAPTADQRVVFAVSGPARIMGVGNGDPSSHEPDSASRRRAFHGRCQALVQALRAPGDVTVRVSAEGLAEATVALTVHGV